jgi:hypothetical protein
MGLMHKGKSNLILVVVLAILLGGMNWPTASLGANSKLAQVVYITMSKACSCTLERCQAGDIMVENVFNGGRQGLLKRLDYSTNKEAAKVYIKNYHVTQTPALLFLDSQGNLLWMTLGELSEKDIQAKLNLFGG